MDNIKETFNFRSFQDVKAFDAQLEERCKEFESAKEYGKLDQILKNDAYQFLEVLNDVFKTLTAPQEFQELYDIVLRWSGTLNSHYVERPVMEKDMFSNPPYL